MPVVVRFRRGAAVGADVAADDRPLADAVRSLYRAYARPLRQSRRPPDIAVRRLRDGFELVTAAGEATETFHRLPDLLARVEFLLTEALLGHGAAALHLHAAGVVTSRGAVLLLGGSGAGKSSVATALSLLRAPALGDDVVTVRPDGRVAPFHRLFKVDRALLPGLGIEPAATPFFDPAGTTAWFDPAPYGGWADSPAPVHLVALLHRVPGGPTTAVPLAPARTLQVIAASRVSPNGGTLAPPALDALAAIAESARGIRLAFSSSSDAARRVMEGAW